jgi:hypothetical protein
MGLGRPNRIRSRFKTRLMVVQLTRTPVRFAKTNTSNSCDSELLSALGDRGRGVSTHKAQHDLAAASQSGIERAFRKGPQHTMLAA